MLLDSQFTLMEILCIMILYVPSVRIRDGISSCELALLWCCYWLIEGLVISTDCYAGIDCII
jgi:hypothetical protein